MRWWDEWILLALLFLENSWRCVWILFEIDCPKGCFCLLILLGFHQPEGCKFPSCRGLVVRSSQLHRSLHQSVSELVSTWSLGCFKYSLSVYIYIYISAGWWFGCHQFCIFPYNIGNVIRNNHPNWRTPSYFSEGWPNRSNHQPVVVYHEMDGLILPS